MNLFKRTLETKKHVIAFDTDVLESALAPSKGSSEMSIADIKMAILGLQGIVKAQQEIINVLCEELSKEPKKTLFQRIFNK